MVTILIMPIYINDNNNIRSISGFYINDAGSIRTIQAGYINDAGTIRQFYSSGFQAPTSITAVNNSTSTPAILINWSASTSGSNSVTYDLYKSTSSTPAPTSSTAASSGLGGISGTSENNTGGLTFGTTYYYWVRAVDSTGAKTAWTGPASAVPEPPPPPPPEPKAKAKRVAKPKIEKPTIVQPVFTGDVSFTHIKESAPPSHVEVYKQAKDQRQQLRVQRVKSLIAQAI